MQRVSVWSGAWIGALTSALALAAMQLGKTVSGVPLAAFDIFEWLTRALPGGIVTRGIDVMMATLTALGIGPTSVAAKLAEQGMAVALFVGGSAVLGAIVAAAGRTAKARLALGLGAGAAWLALELVAAPPRWWSAVVLLGWGALLGALVRTRAAVGDHDRERRRFLVATVAGTAVMSALVLGVSALVRGGRRAAAFVAGREPRVATDVTETSGAAVSPRLEELAHRLAPVPGTRPEITPNDAFYRIDINLEPPRIDPQTWRLVVDGLVANRLVLSLDELIRMPAVSQMVTLECISNPVGGDLIGTSLWTGVRLRDVLARAGVHDSARAVHVFAADGFYESVGSDDLADERTLLVYAMNRAPLTEPHGSPLRIFIPDRHGMKQPKWITRLSVRDHDGPGYWVDRGWSRTAIPHTTAVIDVVAPGDAIAVGGIAYAGARGIRRVEVQVDDGPWATAQVIAPPLGPLTWVQWRYDGPRATGRRTFRARATDGTGAIETAAIQAPHPDGATGIHAVTRRG